MVNKSLTNNSVVLLAMILKSHYPTSTTAAQAGMGIMAFLLYGGDMAQKRMFNKSITNSSRFLMMPQSTQALYFHLGMNADDDGFCEHFAIMRMTESKPDDLKILQVKSFIHVFDDHILIIKDWKENNYLRSDRYTPSKYLEIYKCEIDKLSECIPLVYQTVDKLDTQISIDKIRLDKNSKDKNRIDNNIYQNLPDECFDDFWNLYDKKRGKPKTIALWKKMNPDASLYNTILNHVRKYVVATEQKFRKDPERYLKNECWNDEVINDKKQKQTINRDEELARLEKIRSTPYDELR
jgi:hypothetical protein